MKRKQQVNEYTVLDYNSIFYDKHLEKMVRALSQNWTGKLGVIVRKQVQYCRLVS